MTKIEFNGVKPRLNLNGTSAVELTENWQGVIAAADALRDALVKVVPNGRDYQTLPDAHEAHQRDYREVHAMLTAARRIADAGLDSQAEILRQCEEARIIREGGGA